jgi:hypothetical protein
LVQHRVRAPAHEDTRAVVIPRATLGCEPVAYAFSSAANSVGRLNATQCPAAISSGTMCKGGREPPRRAQTSVTLDLPGASTNQRRQHHGSTRMYSWPTASVRHQTHRFDVQTDTASRVCAQIVLSVSRNASPETSAFGRHSARMTKSFITTMPIEHVRSARMPHRHRLFARSLTPEPLGENGPAARQEARARGFDHPRVAAQVNERVCLRQTPAVEVFPQ